MRIRSFLALTRPANVVTAFSDILAGVAIAGIFTTDHLYSFWNLVILLLISTAGLYAGGIVFNDYFDRQVDKIERPERLIPSGEISAKEAKYFGVFLFLIAIIVAFQVNATSGLVATTITILAVIYDRFSKHHKILGPLNMGFCRGLNLVLGMSILPATLSSDLVFMGLLPVIFISAITLTSQGEVKGDNRAAIKIALGLDILVAAVIVILGLYQILNIYSIIPFLFLWAGMNIRAKVRAIIRNSPPEIMYAVKTGVMSIIPLNAIYAAGFGHWWFGIAVLLLLPLAFLLSKRFAVT